MDIRKIKKLIELVEESGITELEVSEEEGTVRISRAAPVVAAPAVQYTAAPTPVAAPAAAPAAAPSTPAAPANNEVSGHIFIKISQISAYLLFFIEYHKGNSSSFSNLAFMFPNALNSAEFIAS